AQTSTMTVATSGGTPLGNNTITINGSSGSLVHSAQVGFRVISASSVDVVLTKTSSPNPGQVGLNLSYRITATNNGPATATNVIVTDTLPAGVTFVSSTTNQGACSGTSTVTCAVGTLGVNSTGVITIVVAPASTGQLTNTASVTQSE